MPTFYHVTERDDAQSILEDGFDGGWGDVGFGVYMFDNPLSAKMYAADGGWDNRLQDPVIIAIDTDDFAKVIPELSWPNPEDYAAVYWHPMDEDNDEYWQPTRVLLEEQRQPRQQTRLSPKMKEL